MSFRLLGIALLLAGVLLGHTWADTGPGFNRVMKWRSFPNPTALEALNTTNRAALLPAWKTGALGKPDYIEIYDNKGQVHASLTCADAEPGIISVIYYSPAGQSRLVSQGLDLQRDHQTSLTYLPGANENTALTLVTLWRKAPSTELLAQLMLEGRPSAQPVADLYDMRWFSRSAPLRRDPPWQATFSQQLSPPTGFSLSDWPLCIAECRTDQSVLEKDCSLEFRGMSSFALEQNATYGYWQLSWDSPLILSFDLPGPNLPQSATLVVVAQVDGMLMFGSEAELEAKANGNQLKTTAIPASQLTVAQPIAFELSPYLQRGLNTVEVGRSAFSNVNWKARRIELWAR